jgi:hypothetical protein
MVLTKKFAIGVILGGICICQIGCADNPGTWPLPKVEAKLTESLQLSDVNMEAAPDGGFTGTGKSAEGETISFSVKQDAAARRISWDAKGDRGFVEEGYYEHQ